MSDFSLIKKLICVLGIFLAFLSFAPHHAFAFSPSDISGLNLWLDASQGVTHGFDTDAGADIVTQWNDQSGHGNNATPVDSVYSDFQDVAPTYIPNGFNGHPTFEFDGYQTMATPSFLDSSYDHAFTALATSGSLREDG